MRHGPYMRSIDDIPSMSCSLTVDLQTFRSRRDDGFL